MFRPERSSVPATLPVRSAFVLWNQPWEKKISPFTKQDLYAPDDPDASRFLELVNSSVEMIMVLNELAHSMGQPYFYPFVMSRPVVAKLQLVQMIVVDARSQPKAEASARGEAA